MEDQIYFASCEKFTVSDASCENYVKPFLQTFVKPVLHYIFPKRVPMVEAVKNSRRIEKWKDAVDLWTGFVEGIVNVYDAKPLI